jgi:cytochrome c peroxidase
LASVLVLPLSFSSAQTPPPPLDTVRVPRPTNLRAAVLNEPLALQLGKALFWDEQLGSDGRTACATCHHHAGADSRNVNTMHPGANGTFQSVVLGGALTASRFPIRNDDVVGSQGVVLHDFLGIAPASAIDVGAARGSVFGALPQVTRRNTPSTINAIFNQVQFWDGRAVGVFNGRTIDGSPATVLQARADGSILPVSLRFDFASAAAQAVGPPDSEVEMAWAGRKLADLGKKMLTLKPLGLQRVHAQDSLLGALRDPSGIGLATSYRSLIEGAFQPRWWRSNAILDRAGNIVGRGTPVGPDQFSLTEMNFSMFFGLAIQLYEATLVSSDAPIDRFARGDVNAMTQRQKDGLTLFTTTLRCNRCHGGSEFTNASFNVGGDRSALASVGVEPFADDAGDGLGEFKTPSLRNVELTGPYFHNGQFATLRQVVAFYNHGGDEPNTELVPLNLSELQKLSLVDFLVSLTDERVRFRRAPFDHPSLTPVNGVPLTEVGAAGAAAPLPTFLGLSPFQGF